MPCWKKCRSISIRFFRIPLSSCLELAEQRALQSIAFCCISTGVFSFPPILAAEIAIRTVKEYLQKETGIQRVIFNVFKDSDLEIYHRLLSGKAR